MVGRDQNKYRSISTGADLPLDRSFFFIQMNKLHHNGQLHRQMKSIVLSERDNVLKTVDLYY